MKSDATYVSSGGSYAFTDVTEGETGTAVTFTIENTGTATLSLSGSPIVSISGTNASDFTISQTSTSASVSASGSTTFTITFSPVTAGSKSATISIANNDASENPYTISLSGNGLVATSVMEALNKGIKVYPNPAGNVLYISTEGENISGIILRNQFGATVRDMNLAAGQTEVMIELAEISSGIYSLEMESSEGTIVRKIVKQ